MKVPQYRFSTLQLLYVISLEEKIRFTFAYTDCMSLVLNKSIYFKLIKLIAHFPEPQVGKELISLSINLGINKRNAEQLSDEEI